MASEGAMFAWFDTCEVRGVFGFKTGGFSAESIVDILRFLSR
jgi:hypothetical protein